MWPFKSREQAKEQQEFSRIEAEDMIDLGMKCKEIAEELGTTEMKIYRIKQAKDRREARLGPKQESQPHQDRLKEIEIQIKEAELKDKLAETQHNSEVRAAQREEAWETETELTEKITDAAEDPDRLLMALIAPYLAGAVGGKGIGSNRAEISQENAPLGVIDHTKNAPGVEPNSQPQQQKTPEIDIPKIIQLAKLAPKETVLNKLKEFGATEQQAEKIYKTVIKL